MLQDCMLRQVVTVALDVGAMAACVRLRGPQPCVLDSWNTSRLAGVTLCTHEPTRLISGYWYEWFQVGS